MQICDYGCGQKAIHQFKNGKWCCGNNVSNCRYIIDKLKNRKVSKETKIKQSKSLKGREVWNKDKHLSKEHKLKIGVGNKDKIISKKTRKKLSKSLMGNKNHFGCRNSLETIEKMSKSRVGKVPWNKNKRHSIETLDKLKIANKLTIKQIKNRYPTFTKVEKLRYEPCKENVIQAHCKNHNCKNSKEQGGWFNPSYYQLANRIHNIEKGNGAGYFYCCEECKQQCPLFNKKIITLIKEDQIRAGHIEDPWYNSAEYYAWRKYIFNLDGGLCVYCGQPATIAHHILPQKTHPESALDSENGLSVCQECHFKYGHRDSWCTTGKLSTLICERIIRFKAKLSN